MFFSKKRRFAKKISRGDVSCGYSGVLFAWMVVLAMKPYAVSVDTRTIFFFLFIDVDGLLALLRHRTSRDWKESGVEWSF